MANYRCGGPTGIACLTMLTLLGCSRHASDTRAQMQWAHEALVRNDSIEVVAEDPTSRTFTVRVKSSGELRMVHADEMIASPAALGAATDQPAATPRALAAGAPATAAAASSPAAPSAASTEPPMPEPPPPPAVQPSTLASQTAAASSGRVLESGPGYSITAGSAGGTSGARLRDANVHIDNSVSEGGQASIDASEGAQVYAASSQFRGLSRRLDTAAFHDLGGNSWN